MDKDIRTKLEEAGEKNYQRVKQEMVAMLQIEERATEFALKEIRCGSVEELELWGTEVAKKAFEEIRGDYIRIATEQEAVDDELLKRVRKGVLDKAVKEKKEAAMKAYCRRCQDMGGGYPCSHKCYEYIEHAKTLEGPDTGNLNALLQTETAEETIKRQALLLDGFIGAEEKPEWKTKAKSLLDRANQLKAYDNEGEQEWFGDVVAFLEELTK